MFPGQTEDQYCTSICFWAVSQRPQWPVLHSFTVIYELRFSPAITYKRHRYISQSLRGKQDISAKGLSDGSITHTLSPPFPHTNTLLSWEQRHGAESRWNVTSHWTMSFLFTCKIKSNESVRSLAFNVFIAFTGNLKEMRGKEPLAAWTNLVEP